jgi:hypothetical protein
MSYIADDITEIAGHYGFAGSVQEVDNVTTFTSNDGTLRVVARYEIEATLTMTINSQPFEFEDGACNFAKHSIDMVIERLIKAHKVMEDCVAALTSDGWSLEVVNPDYTSNWVNVTKKGKKAYLRVSDNDVHLSGSNRRTVAKVLYNAGVLSSHKQVPGGYSGVYSLAQGK